MRLCCLFVCELLEIRQQHRATEGQVLRLLDDLLIDARRGLGHDHPALLGVDVDKKCPHESSDGIRVIEGLVVDDPNR